MPAPTDTPDTIATARTKPLLTAAEAADYLGYHSPAQFRRAVAQGVFPGPIDPGGRAHRWARAALDAVIDPPDLRDPARPSDTLADDVDELDRRLGMGS